MTDLPAIIKIPPEEYHPGDFIKNGGARPLITLSCSQASTLLNKSPAHCREGHAQLNPDYEEQQKDVFDLGSAAHNMALRQDFWREEIDIIDARDWKTKKAKEAKAESRAAGRYPILVAQYGALEAMVLKLEAHPQAGRAFTQGQPEMTLVWRDEQSGVVCRARPDWTPDDQKFDPWPDYKTTQEGKPGVWDRRYCLDHGGILRAAWYHEAIRQCCGVERPVQYYVVQEVSAPYVVTVRVVPLPIIDLGRRMMRRALTEFARCLKSDDWPGYDFLTDLSCPQWAFDRLDEEYEGFVK